MEDSITQMSLGTLQTVQELKKFNKSVVASKKQKDIGDKKEKIEGDNKEDEEVKGGDLKVLKCPFSG